MPRKSKDEFFHVTRTEGIALLRWSFTVVGAVMSSLLLAASQAGDNLSFYLMTLSLFKLVLWLFLFLLGLVFAALSASLMGISERESRNRWRRIKLARARIGWMIFYVNKVKRWGVYLYTRGALLLVIIIFVLLPYSFSFFGLNSLRADLELSKELLKRRITQVKSEAQLSSGDESALMPINR
ncbi:hypothetical protein [Thioclava sp. GXIMD2076]|uniref:hypothetical protein n=1 Tax=Thioclava sp. GXIMD2076 TaxID=3131931 RepID=UPI0030D519A0